ncbi:MAG: hypothetical protein LBD42_06590, partial [Desulfovibrio sp.]|nr:hypothetical protein [Desulfovibrio sp.]
MNTFTRAQEAQILKELDRLIQVGTAHICLADVNFDERDEGSGIEWYKVRAYVPYPLVNTATGEEYRDDKCYGTAEQLPGGGAALFQAVKFPKKGGKSGKNCLIYSRFLPF